MGGKTARTLRQVRAGIADGTYRPGTLLPGEQRLAEQCGVHRTTVRTALAQLRDQGLIAVLPGTGWLVMRAPQR